MLATKLGIVGSCESRRALAAAVRRRTECTRGLSTSLETLLPRQEETDGERG